MPTIYYIQDKRCDYPKYVEPLFYGDEDSLRYRMERLTDGFTRVSDNENYEVRSFEVNDKCKCDNYMQTTMVLLDMRDPQRPQIVGTNNWLGIHQNVRMQFDIDIEKYTAGAYELMTMDYFQSHYRIEKQAT